jgi:hypothetical protein
LDPKSAYGSDCSGVESWASLLLVVAMELALTNDLRIEVPRSVSKAA